MDFVTFAKFNILALFDLTKFCAFDSLCHIHYSVDIVLLLYIILLDL